MKVYRCLTLRGNVEDGIEINGNQVRFWPSHGMLRQDKSLACSTIKQGMLRRVRIFRTASGLVLVPAEEKASPHQELVLIQEYRPGCGAKRWPSFEVCKDGLTILSHAMTDGGSGSETWTLAIAPLGWARDIAAQFVNERDVPSQLIRSRIIGGGNGQADSSL